MGGQLRLPRLGGDGRRDHRGAVAIAGIVLHDQHRAHAPLLAADHGTEVRVIDIAPSDYAVLHDTSHSAGIIVLRYSLKREVLCNAVL